MQPFAQACGLPVGRHAALPSPLQLDLLQRLPLGLGHDGMHRQHRAQADEREGHEDAGGTCGVKDGCRGLSSACSPKGNWLGGMSNAPNLMRKKRPGV